MLRLEGKGRELTLVPNRTLHLPACTPRERAMVAFAIKLTKEPSAVDEDDLAAVRAEGLDDREIHDLVNCVGYFAYANRIVAGLGVYPGGREGVAGQ